MNAAVASIAEARVSEALTGGATFLLAAQDRDGLWREFETLAGEASDWPTAWIGVALLENGARGPAIDTAADALLERQHRDGGWGYHVGVPSDADSTAWALLFLAAAGRGRSTMEQAGRCLRRHQDPRSGGVTTYADPGPIRRYMGVGRGIDVRGWCARHLEVTAAAGRAFAAVPDGRFADDARLAWRYVSPRQAADGGWRSYWWLGQGFPTLQAVALASALGDREPLSRAARWALSEQPAPGGEPSAFATALSLGVLLRAGGPREAVNRGLVELIRLQQDDGGWPSDAAMRIPPPHLVEPDDHESWRVDELGTGVIVRDRNRLFTTAACVSTLALAAASAL